MYERKLNPLCLVLSIDSPSIAALEKMGWRLFSGMGQAIFPPLGAKP